MNDNRLSFEETTRQVGLPGGKQLTPPRRYTAEEQDAAAVVARRYIDGAQGKSYSQDGRHYNPGVIDMACRIVELETWNAERIERDFQKNAERSNPNYSKP